MSTKIGKSYTAPVPMTVAPDSAETTAYICPDCGKEYKTEKGLLEHIAKAHTNAAGEVKEE